MYLAPPPIITPICLMAPFSKRCKMEISLETCLKISPVNDRSYIETGPRYAPPSVNGYPAPL